MSDTEDGTTIAVTRKGQATIPKEVCDKLHINTPGRVRFIENEHGDVVIRPVKRPAEIRGALATAESEGDGQTATELLRAARNRDEAMLEQTHKRMEPDK